MDTLSSTYYDRLLGHAGASFANLVQIEGQIEDGLKTWKIKDYLPFMNNPFLGQAIPQKEHF